MKTTLFLAALLLGSLGAPALAGDIAPDLAFTDLLQAPAQAKTDWPSLRGKAVVVNFWATWCVPCVAEIPLMNALAASTDPAKVQFIAADYNGEGRAKIEAFLKKHPMSAWIGVDTARETQKRFGVREVPVTFVIGPDGRVAHVTGHPENLTAEKLTALAEGKSVAFDGPAQTDAKLQDEQKQAAEQAAQDKAASFKATNGKTLASNKAGTIILSEAARAPDDGLPADLARTMIWSPGRFDLLSARVADIAAHLFKTEATRVAVSGLSADKRYNLHVDMPGVTPRAVLRIVSSGLGATFERQTRRKDVLILTATPETARHLDGPGTHTDDHYCAFLPDKSIACEAGSFDALATAIEDGLGTPVLNESKLAGTVTATLPISGTLAEKLGIALTPAKRPIGIIVVSAGS